MRNTVGKLVTSVVLVFLLAPLAPAMAFHCSDHDDHASMQSGADSPHDSMRRCAGLWCSACCDFTSASRSIRDVPGGFDSNAPVPAYVAPIAFSEPLLSRPPARSTLDLLVDDRAGPPPVRLLTSVLLI